MISHRRIVIITSAALALSLAACEDAAPAAEEPSQEVAAAQEELERSSEAGQREAQLDLRVERRAFAQEVRLRLNTLDRRLAALEDEVWSVSNLARRDARDRLEELREERWWIGLQLDAIDDTTEATWAEFKRGVNDALDALDAEIETLGESVAPKDG